MNGIINVYKESGFTSADVVAKLRGILHQKKIGHTGTLDPAAVGVLPVCIGNATKVCDLITDWDKEYEAVLRLGITTDTLDMEGEILTQVEESRVLDLKPEDVERVIFTFLGDSMQIPPMYSALKQNGKRLYELARAGISVEREARPIKITNIEIKDISLPRVTFRVSCSKGTYIRSLCQDIGEKLGVGGCMEHLTRTRVGVFGIDQAIKLDYIETIAQSASYPTGENIVKKDRVIPKLALDENKLIDETGKPLYMDVDSVFVSLPELVVADKFMIALKNGNRLSPEMFVSPIKMENSQRVRVYDNRHKFYAVYEYNSKEAMYKPVKMFL